MDGTVADQAGKRRLPFWKTDVVAVDHSEQHKGETIRNSKPNTRTKVSRKPSTTVKKHETKRRKVNTTHKDDAEISGKRLLTSSDSVDKIETVSSSEDDDDDDEELTMEDLMSIAKEYTGTNETNQREKYIKERRPEVKNGSESESHFNTINVKPQEAFLFHKPPEKESCEKTVVSPPTPTGTGTGDAAQDMLNLFLGPLLKNITNGGKQI